MKKKNNNKFKKNLRDFKNKTEKIYDFDNKQ